MAKMAVLTLALIVALGGLGVGFVRTFDDGAAEAVEPLELRKDDSAPDLVAETDDDDDGDGDSTRGDDGTRGGNNTRDGDSTRGDDGTRGGNNTRDGDSTWGNDATRGGDNTGDGDPRGATTRRAAATTPATAMPRGATMAPAEATTRSSRRPTPATTGEATPVAATRPVEWLIALLLTGAGALCAPAPAAAGGPLARISVDVGGAIPDGEKKTARMTVREGGRTAYRGRIGIERRGQSSQRFPKQAWSVELRDRKGDNRDVSLLGMPADDDWILYAGYNDKTLMRNVLAYETARRLGRYASRARYVEVTLNGRYHGVYVLMEKLKLGKGRLDLAEPAQLMEWTFSFQARNKGRYFRLPVSEYFLLFEDPERKDLGPQRRSRIRGSLGAAERALYGRAFRDRAIGWRRHIDEAAAVDYLLLNELFKNQDAFHASTFLAQGAGGKWQLGPVWDFDISMGNSDYGPSRLLAGSMLEQRAWAERLYRDPALVAAVAARWRALRAAGLRGAILRSVDRHARRLTRTGAAARNFRRWPVLGVRVWPNPPAAVRRTTYASEVAALRRWLERRVAWMDAHVRELKPGD